MIKVEIDEGSGFCFGVVTAIHKAEEELAKAMEDLKRQVFKALEGLPEGENVQVIGPAQATIYKVNDIYRKILYLKHENYDILIKLKNHMDQESRQAVWHHHVAIQFDLA